MEQVKLSIITINYNNRDGLKRTIESVIAQTDNRFEYIVIDGGSTDGSADIIKDNEKSIDYSVSEKDNGIYNAMNKGIREATGEYCLFLNSGDYLYDDNVTANVLPLLSGEDYITGRLKHLPSANSKEFIEYPPLKIHGRTLIYFTLAHPSTFIKTNVLKLRPYDETLKIVADWKQMFESLIMNDCTYKPIDILISNYDTAGVSSTNIEILKEERLKVLSEYLPSKVIQEFMDFYDHSSTFVISKEKDRIPFLIISKVFRLLDLVKKIF